MLRLPARTVRLVAIWATMTFMHSLGADETWREFGRPLMRSYPPGEHLYHSESQTMVQDASGWIYFANGVDLLAFDGSRWFFRRLPTESAGIRQFATARDGTIYAGGAGVLGYLRGVGPSVEFVSLVDRLPRDARNVDEIRFVAAAGDAVYFADDEKILVWRSGGFAVIPCRAPPGQRGARLHVVRDELLVSAPGWPLRRVVGDELVPFADDPLLRNNALVAVAADAATGGLVALTAERGFLAIDARGNVASTKGEANRWLAGKRVFRARQIEDGSWAVAFSAVDGGGGMRFAPDGRFAGALGRAAGMYTNELRDFVCDREGGLWVMLDAGAARLDWPSPATLFDAFNGLGSGGVIGVTRHEGRLIVATEESVFQLVPSGEDWRGAIFEKFTSLPSASLQHELEESRRRAATAFHATDHVKRWPISVRAAVGEAGCAFEEDSSAGRVRWIGGTGGLIRVELAKAFPAPPPLLLSIEAVGVSMGAELPTEHAPLRFRYLAIRQHRANAVLYQSRLAGLEDDWTPWSATREKSYPHLAPGRYRFEVRATDADGVMSEVIALPFTVRPPWWLTGWAIVGYVATLGLALVGTVRLRTRGLRRRAAELERIIAERTAELEQKNHELTRLHQLEFDEKVAARLGEEKARLEVLRYQLNPHFLFNALASISASLPPGPDVGRAMVERLAEFCRLTLQRGENDDWTTLGEEVRLLRSYLAIEQSRWGELLEIELRHDSSLDAERLPHFLLLPLVENALKYGQATSPDRVGIRLFTRRDGNDGIEIEVANTGAWIEPTAKKSVATLGIGLENLRQRLARIYRSTSQLEIAEADGWVVARLRVPFVRLGDGPRPL